MGYPLGCGYLFVLEIVNCLHDKLGIHQAWAAAHQFRNKAYF